MQNLLPIPNGTIFSFFENLKIFQLKELDFFLRAKYTTYFPLAPMNLSGLKKLGWGKLFGSFMMNVRLAKNTDPSGNKNPSTSVGDSVLCAIERGATPASLCTSEIVAWIRIITYIYVKTVDT